VLARCAHRFSCRQCVPGCSRDLLRLHACLLHPAGCAQGFPIFAYQAVFKPAKLQQGPATTSIQASTADEAVPAAANAASGSATAAAARAKQQKAPERCDPKGFQPADGKPLLYLYVWAGALQESQRKDSSSPAAAAAAAAA
jgi:hypothetical protein